MATKAGFNRGHLSEPILAAALVAKFIDRPTKNNRQKTPWVVTDKEIKDVLKRMFKKVTITGAKGSAKAQMIGSLTMSRTDLIKSKSTSKKAFEGLSGNFWKEDPTIIDEVSFKASIPRNDMDWLANAINKGGDIAAVQDLFDSSRNYVNKNVKFNALAKKLATNSKVDKFFIGAVGTADQTGTKIDIILEHNGKRISTQVSLKTEGGDQFAQVAGITFDHQRKLWAEKLGLPKNGIDSLETKFNNTMKKFYDPKKFPKEGYDKREDKRTNLQLSILNDACSPVYKGAADLMNIEFKKDKKRKNNLFLDSMIEFIANGAAGTEADVIELVKLGKGTFKRLNFKKEFRNKMMELDLKATFMKDKGYAQINIDDMASGMPVIQFRLMGQRPSAKRGGKKKYSVYGRNIVEMSSKSILYTILK